MIVPSKKGQVKSINREQDMFCKLLAVDPDIMGNGTKAYMKAYKNDNVLTAKAAANKLLLKPEITARINEYLQQEGFNNENVDKQLLYVINQHRDLSTKVKGIQEYNKLKKRISDRLEIVMPKPIMALDGEEEELRTNTKTLKKDKDTGVYSD